MLTAFVRRKFRAMMDRRNPSRRNAVTLDRRRVYILPTGAGMVYALLLGIMFLWSVNYSNSMGFALTFLLASAGVLGMHRSNGNLQGIVLHPGRAEPVFAGHKGSFRYVLENPGIENRYNLILAAGQGVSKPVAVPAQGSAVAGLEMDAPERGWLQAGRVTISTRFPLGLFRAWSYVSFEQGCLVYPHPEGSRAIPLSSSSSDKGEGSSGAGNDDYAGLRGYVPGDSPRRVAWKASARGAGLLVKQFSGQVEPDLHLNWDSLSDLDIETRLSQLCQWVLQCDSEDKRYGLRLPGLTIVPDAGEAQRRRCLEALALYGESP